MAEIHLASTLPPLFAGCRGTSSSTPRRSPACSTSWTGAGPGCARDRFCEPGPTLRRHIHVCVDRERALDKPLDARSRVDVITVISGG